MADGVSAAESGVSDKASSWEWATAGTYRDKCVSAAVFATFLVLAAFICLVPFVGMIWAQTDSTTENRELAPLPALQGDDGSFNFDFLTDAGTYFEDHFAYRNQLVSANARIRAALGVSSTDQVVVGNNGWLYYGGTLPDYLGQSGLSDRALANIAHNMSLAQDYVQSQGASFLFVISPNKNSLYPENMPYYYIQASDAGNAELLKPRLVDAGVEYLDAFELFESFGDCRYLMRDTHWDNIGALRAAQAMLAAVGHATLDAGEDDAVKREDFVGDLESMLYPSESREEPNWYIAGINDGEGMTGTRWSYAEGSDVTDSWIVTDSPEGSGSLVMYRDSFGNALVPYEATAYEHAVFSKLIPYNLPVVAQNDADAVIIERAERHLDYLAKNPPIMPNPLVRDIDLPAEEALSAELSSTVAVAENGPYWTLSGCVGGGSLSEDARIYVAVEDGEGSSRLYDAFWTSVAEDDEITSDFGFQVYLGRSVVDLPNAEVRVFVDNGESLVCAGSFDHLQPDTE